VFDSTREGKDFFKVGESFKERAGGFAVHVQDHGAGIVIDFGIVFWVVFNKLGCFFDCPGNPGGFVFRVKPQDFFHSITS